MNFDDDDVPPPTEAAREIHERFWKKMEPGGEIDQILRGGPNAEKRAPLPDEQIDLIKKQIDVQLSEYEAAIRDAVTWYSGRKRKRRGFRAMERRHRAAP